MVFPIKFFFFVCFYALFTEWSMCDQEPFRAPFVRRFRSLLMSAAVSDEVLVCTERRKIWFHLNKAGLWPKTQINVSAVATFDCGYRFASQMFFNVCRRVNVDVPENGAWVFWVFLCIGKLDQPHFSLLQQRTNYGSLCFQFPISSDKERKNNKIRYIRAFTFVGDYRAPQLHIFGYFFYIHIDLAFFILNQLSFES